MMSSKIELKRGDSYSCTVSIDKTLYEPDSTLYFSAKERVDNDKQDSKAVIHIYSNEVEVNHERNKATYKFLFAPSDTESITFKDNDPIELLGEFEYVTPSGKVFSFPKNNKFIRVTVYPDIRRRGTDG